ncbi:hypothetical protein BD309DRAFT_1068016 [Dichomitus squalens]|nr:hypothetical protein BD309DRAFT_1068016 [Dichomitus squalens]
MAPLVLANDDYLGTRNKRLDSDIETRNTTGAGAIVVSGCRRHLRGRRGGLKDLPHMPLDVIFEVLSHVTTKDLLALSRSTKDFRRLLLNRHSTRIWRQSRKQLEGLPEPPSYLNEPAYANLLFSPHCHNCLKVNINTVLWLFSARYCNPCKRILFSADRNDVETLLREVMGEARGGESALRYIRRHQGKYHTEEVATIRNEWVRLKTDEEKEAYKDRRKAFVEECEKYASLLPHWRYSYNERLFRDKLDLRAARFEAIKDRLREEGWADVIDHLHFNDDWRLSNLKEVSRTTKLTDNGWKHIRQSIVDFVAPLRLVYARNRLTRVCEARLASIRMTEEKLVSMYRTRLRYLRELLDSCQLAEDRRTAESDLKPGFAEFADIPEIKSLVRNEMDDITPNDFLALQGRLADLIVSWTDHWQAVFIQKALAAGELDDIITPTTSLLDLAIVSFVCQSCRQTQLRWPYVLAHRCFRQIPTVFSVGRRKTHGTYSRAVWGLVRHNNDAPFEGGQHAIFSRHVAITRAVIAACGLDASTATYGEMENCGARLVCSFCSIHDRLAEGKYGVFAWQAAIYHSISSHPNCHSGSVDDWERISDSDATRVKEREISRALNTISSLGDSDVVLGCTQCNYHGSLAEVQEHVLFDHWLWLNKPLVSDELVLNEDDVYVHQDSAHIMELTRFVQLEISEECS